MNSNEEVVKTIDFRNGLNYVLVGSDFKDSRDVFDVFVNKLGTINFMANGKPYYNKGLNRITKYIDGFVFEPIKDLAIPCSTFKNIARYVYELNEKLKELQIQQLREKEGRT